MKIALSTCLLVCCLISNSQYRIEGKVMSSEDEILIGATVKMTKNQSGTVTDENGEFTLENISPGQLDLEISYVGFETAYRSINVSENVSLSIRLEESLLLDREVFVYATRAQEKTPMTYSEMGLDKIAERNLGQDLPILMNFQPSVVTTSDAGGGIGYTGMRIRGSDATRINVTINGIPVNDSESHGVFWVNMPDFSSSVQSLQIQRGVGTSSNGAAAFGATVNLQTSGVSREASGEVISGIGSFNTRRNTVKLNTGLIKDRFNLEGRLSSISSDGYIDRSGSDLKSYYLSGGFYGDKTLIKAVVFGGKEVTQQAWYGTPEARLSGDSDALQSVIDLGGEYGSAEQVDNLLNSDRRFNYYLYDNEVDNYQQDHYQLLINQELSQSLNFSGALHHTYGRGYFEQFRENDELASYLLPDVVIGDSTITNSDVVRRRWLENDFYGFTYGFNYSKDKLELTLGGGYNIYDGDHFGEVIWSQYASTSSIRDRYYDGVGLKKDFNTYLKANYQVGEKLNLFGDIQLRNVDYSANGIDNDLASYDFDEQFSFLNPKLGLTYKLSDKISAYTSYAIGNREPVRSDFIDAPNGSTPKSEQLQDLEVGIRSYGQKLSYEVNYFHMNYKDQLVLTGALNDVGASVRANVPESFRAGIEVSGLMMLTEEISWNANVTLSQNKIRNFTEVVYDYAFDDDRFLVENDFRDTDISFSPNVIVGSTFEYRREGFSAQVLSKYVGKQFLDNTSSDDRAIDAYFTHDIRLSYNMSIWELENVGLNLLINNALDLEYESNGYTWGYLWEGSLYQQNNYYPQAGRNFLLGLNIKF